MLASGGLTAAPFGAEVFGLVPDFHCRTGVYKIPCRHALVDTCRPADKLEKSKNGFKSERFEGKSRFDEGNAAVAARKQSAASLATFSAAAEVLEDLSVGAMAQWGNGRAGAWGRSRWDDRVRWRAGRRASGREGYRGAEPPPCRVRPASAIRAGDAHRAGEIGQPLDSRWSESA